MSIEREPEYYDDYYRNSSEYTLPYGKSVYYDMWKIVLSLIKDKITIIELGCGTGQFAQMCIDAGKNYFYGYDFSLEAITIAKENFNLCVCRVGDITKVNIGNCIVVCLETLEHTRDFKVIENIGLGKEFIFSLPDFAHPSHVRYFHSVNEIVDRYKNVIKFDYIQKFQSWYICKGTTI